MCPIGFLMLGAPAGPAEPSPSPCRSACPGGKVAGHRLPTTKDPRMHPASPGRPRGRAGYCPTTSHSDGQVQTDASAGPAPPAPASSTKLRLRQTTSRASTQRATTPTPAIPAVRLPAPPPRSRTSLRPDTADAATHKHRTPTPDAHTGRRTADTWTPRRPHRTLDIGPVDRQAWTLVARTGHRTPDTGHRTLAEDADRRRRRGRHPDLLGHHAERPPLGRPTVFCGRRLRRSATHAGSAVRPLPAR